MTITYRDNIGYISVEVNTEYGINFDGTSAYFTDTENSDYKISVSDIVEINA